MTSVAVLLCVLAAASALPQFNRPVGPAFQPFRQTAPSDILQFDQPPVTGFSPFQQAASTATPFHRTAAVSPRLTSRTEQFDEAGQYTRSHYLDDGTAVQETGALVPNDANDGLVLIMKGNYQYVTPEGKDVRVEWIADQGGYRILSSNAVPVAPSPLPSTF